jgi:hypothetical protein
MGAMPKRRTVALLAGILLALNVVLALAQSSTALPWNLGNKLLGPNMVRAEIVWKSGGVLHDYLLDSGRIRNVAVSSITLVEKDGKVVTVPVSPTAKITLNNAPVPLSSLRRGMRATTIRDGNAPADTVQASPR